MHSVPSAYSSPGLGSFLPVFSVQVLTVCGQCDRTNVWGREVGLPVQEEQADVIGDCAVVVALVQFHLAIWKSIVESAMLTNIFLFCLHLPHCKSLLVWIVAVEFMTAYHDTQLGRRHPVECFISAKPGCVLTRRNSGQQ